MDLPRGLYEQVVDTLLQRQLSGIDTRATRLETEPLRPEEAPSLLAQYIGKVTEQVLARATGADSLLNQIEACNRMLESLDTWASEDNPARITPDARRLMSLIDRDGFVERPVARPDTPLAMGWLLTGTRQDPSLAREIQHELASADRVDILCSFIKWSGIRILAESLEEFTHRTDTRLRVITTSYMGATDVKAVEFLRKLPNTEIRVSYDTKRTRLHAKSYVFHRATGFGTAYIGSANISHAALSEGLEWNVKVSQYESVHLWEKVGATFEAYWEDRKDFHPYTESDRDKLQIALQSERESAEDEVLFLFDLQPYPYQQEILDRLATERELHNRFRNLIVAATGTGKTVIAAFDYRREVRAAEALVKSRPGLLYVAHREEILKQSRACFRAVLRDANFGDLLVGRYQPTQDRHLFASIQSLYSRETWETLKSDHFDYIVIDETHHAVAESYQPLLAHFRPRILLGLTATPERMDGEDILSYFDNHISAEIRLPEAINRKLLCPFQYFGISDDTVDYSLLNWTNGRYQVRELEECYTDNQARVGTIVQAVTEKLLDVHKARGLGFCASVTHANFMAGEFRRCGIRAEALSSESPEEHRRSIQDRLRRHEINFIFVVDLYNEGIDIPEIDTVLFLRPTESLTVFLQQLGRGLRLAEGKDCLTVLDFIGQAHRSYNFESRFRALMSRAERSVDKEIANGFPNVPVGCVIQLEKVAEGYVLDNIRAALAQATRPRLVQRLAGFERETGKAPTLANFLNHYEISLDALYAKGSWSRLCRDAGVIPAFSDPDERAWAGSLRRLARMNGTHNIRMLLDLVTGSGAANSDEATLQRTLLMLHFTLWGKNGPHPRRIEGVLDRIHQHPVLYRELQELLEVMLARLDRMTCLADLPFPCALEVHADYSRDQILAGTGFWTLQRQREVREGVVFGEAGQVDILFVTLNKTEDHYSPTTMYRDYPISEDLFHWQSQSTTSADSPTGQRYIHHQETGGTVLLFVREDKNVNGMAAPYTFLGPVEYVRHTGSKPMNIEWRLRYPMPVRLLKETG